MTVAALKPGDTIGVIGGGQLGRMLAIAAARLGFRVVILDPDPDCPAGEVAGRRIVAAYDDPDALAELARLADVVTYEFENVPVSAAEALARDRPVRPPPKALSAAQDRVAEKTFLNGIGVATASFRAVATMRDLDQALRAFDGAGVLKTRRLGYDGKGQIVLGDGDARPAAKLIASGVPLVLETLIAFEREISVIAARGVNGAITAYDAARNEHEGGILRRSTVPAGITAKTAAEAQAIAFQILEALDYVGIIGVEFFVQGDGALLVNEIAPRVHNSGHWTEAACAVSQFEQHIRAIAGLPLGATRRHSDCVMENLIGAEVERAATLLSEPDAVVHLYGKRETRPGRKMGHVTRLLGPAGDGHAVDSPGTLG